MFGLSEHDLVGLLASYGYWVVLLFVAVESMGVPVPGESILLAAAIYAGTTHRLLLILVITAAAAGAILGDNLGFLIGQQGGYRLLNRYGRYLRVDEGTLSLAHTLFAHHGGKVVFFGRFLPMLRIWAAFLAGMQRMPWRRFLVFNAAGGVLWAALMGTGAYTLGATAAHVGGAAGTALAVLTTATMAAVTTTLHRKQTRSGQRGRTVCTPCAL